MRRPRQTLAAALLLPLLAACGGAPQASNPPTLDRSPSASPTAPEPPALPTSATRGGAPGATAFVKHWVDVLNFAGASGQTAALEELSATDCVRCEALVSGIDAIYKDGSRIEGGGWTVTSTRPYGTREQRFFIDAVIDSEPQSVVSSDGTKKKFDGAQDRLRAFVLKRTSSGWLVAELDPTA